MSGADSALMMSAGGFYAQHVYTAGTAATETVPSGASFCVIEVYGGGASGGQDSSGPGGGGGGGAYSKKTISVVGGNVFTYTVAQSVNSVHAGNHVGTNGQASTVSGTVAGGAVSINSNGVLAAQGGFAAGNNDNGGAGGVASGGDTNIAGGGGAQAGGGGQAAGPLGGNSDNPPGGGGSGGAGTTNNTGWYGRISFTYS